MQEKEAAEKKAAVQQVCTLLFPSYRVMFTPRSMIMSGNGQTITIKYSILTTEPDGTQILKDNLEKKVYFKSYPSVPAWEMGKNITYTIEIDPAGDIIHFAPRVIDWENIDGIINF
jgi:hypothetical protein